MPAASGRPPLGRKLLVVFGPPGTGKTTRLMDLLASELGAGTSAEDIAFVTFTRAARAEARDRVRREFQLGDDDLPWFRTIHSAAYRLLGITRPEVMNAARWSEFARRYGYELSDTSDGGDDDDPSAPPTRTPDDLLRSVLEWGRNRRIGLDTALARYGTSVPARQAHLFAERLATFKAEHNLVDFSDMLERVIVEGVRPEVQVAFVDEAQDLSPLQIAVVENWFAGCERVYVAGDDDQAVYAFQGAEPAWLLGLHGRASVVEVLTQSYRIPSTVHAVASDIIGQNRTRVPKAYKPRVDSGSVSVVPADRAIAATGAATSVFILARNRMFLREWAGRLSRAAEPFVAESGGSLSPLGDPAVARAIDAGQRLREGRSLGARDLEALLRFVPSRGAKILPHGAKTRAERNRAPVTRQELEEDWGLGTLLELLDAGGPVEVLTMLPAPSRAYLARLLARHGGQLPPPRFRLATIHGSKGREADAVIVIPDMTKASYAEFAQGGRAGEEAENRVAYVAVTRARHALILVEPETQRFYPYDRFLRARRPAA